MRRVVVIGAGAAGTMAAIAAAAAGAQVVLLERTRDGGRKILISGGGRCNVLPARVTESRFVTDSSPNLLRKMIRAWPLSEQKSFFESTLGIPLEEEDETAKLFPASHRARDVRDGLLNYAGTLHVDVRFNAMVLRVRPTVAGWSVQLADGELLEADSLVVATGGLSVPKTGSDGTGLSWLRELGHTMHPTYPALTPIIGEPSPFTALAGISLPVVLSAKSAARSARAAGGFLFTHVGYSGPAVLDVSHVLVRASIEGDAEATLKVQWSTLNEPAWVDAFTSGRGNVLTVMRRVLPDRLASVLLAIAGVDVQRSLADLRKEERRRLIEVLVHCELPWRGDQGYQKAEVTGGGVALSEVHAATMESRRCPRLYLCGEVLDAFGPIGGYNFLWSWATGRAAGTAAAF